MSSKRSQGVNDEAGLPVSSSTAEASGGGSRSKRQELSFADRIKVIEERKSGKSMRQLALMVIQK